MARYDACIICGYLITKDRSRPWVLLFRILYSFEEIACISGLGLYTPSEWMVPKDEDSSVWLMFDEPLHENDHRSFVLHDACWILLQRAMDPNPVPLGRLLDVCKSLPNPICLVLNRPDAGMYRDYDYGGIMLVNEQNHYPEATFVRRLYDEREAREDPYNVIIKPQLLAKPRGDSESRVPRPCWDGRESRDCFSTLPWELREVIAMALPTCDVLKLQQASRSFVGITTSQVFWASRFARGGECDFIFEMQGKQGIDWKQLYRNYGTSRASLGLQNRMRIWDGISSIKGLLGLRLNGVQSRVPEHCEYQGMWRQVSGDTKELIGRPLREIHDGCWVFDKVHVVVPPLLTHIAISIIRVGTVDYVVGLRLISSDSDNERRMGYQAEGKELFFAVTASALRGFTIAVSQRGIRALQVLCRDGTRSPWFGCPVNALITNRLCHAEGVVALGAEFDGYKLVSLSVAGWGFPKLHPSELGLRETALWYPDVPPQSLLLNEASFIGEPSEISLYRPMPWILFGGMQGELFPHLTMVSVSRSKWSLYSIRFHYNCEGLPDTEMQFKPAPTENNVILCFPIDGPGGESITTLTTFAVNRNDRPVISRIFSFEIATNRGRSFHFHPAKGPVSPHIRITLSVAPGSTLVGLFVSQHPEKGIIGLGVISAVVGA